MDKRWDDSASTVIEPRRRSRLLNRDGAWWFLAREGAMGPFETMEQANHALDQFVKVAMKEKAEQTQHVHVVGEDSRPFKLP